MKEFQVMVFANGKSEDHYFDTKIEAFEFAEEQEKAGLRTFVLKEMCKGFYEVIDKDDEEED